MTFRLCLHPSAPLRPCDLPKMNLADMPMWKERLLALRFRLRGEVSQMADAALNESDPQANGSATRMPIHMADLGTEAFEQEFTLRLVENEEETLRQIDASLERIEDGTYGRCEECGTQIPEARLSAIPYATCCVKCATLLEQG